jgi:hypothetical protein
VSKKSCSLRSYSEDTMKKDNAIRDSLYDLEKRVATLELQIKEKVPNYSQIEALSQDRDIVALANSKGV